MKKGLFIVLCAGLFTFACTPKEDTSTLLVAHKGEMESLDPVYSYDGVTQGMMLNVYDTLLKFKGSSMTELEPSLSTEVPTVQNGLLSADGLTYTFPIRKGVKFHNGEILTPEDVRYSLLRFMLSDVSGGPSSLLLEPILGVSSTRGENGEYTVTYEEAAKAYLAACTKFGFADKDGTIPTSSRIREVKPDASAGLDDLPTYHLALPAEGVYAGYVTHGDTAWPAAINVGKPRSFSPGEEGAPFLEATLLGFSGDLYGADVAVVFARWLREPRTFSSVKELEDVVLGNVSWVRATLGERGISLRGEAFA